jgi:hypothetical protein
MIATRPSVGSPAWSNEPSSRPPCHSAVASCPELARSDLREVFVRSYRIVYRVSGDDTRILTIFEGHRRLRFADVDDT